MAKLKQGQVSASTLMEVVVGMIIILIVFTLATGIFTGVLHSSPNLRRTYMNCIADSIINNTISKKEEVVIIEDSLLFIKKIDPVDGHPDLYRITVHINDHGKQAGELSRIVKIKVDDK